MFITESILSVLAPHHCMICGNEGKIVCDWCLPDFASLLPERCYRCLAYMKDSRVCEKCRRSSKLKHVWVRAQYEGDVKQLIHDFKFERKQAAAEPIAQMMTDTLPFFSPDVIVTHVPTASRRVRMRGYDHAELIAKSIASRLGLKHQTLLRRTSQTRQVGAKRSERIKQMEHAFKPEPNIPKNIHVLLVDDLVTTGATLESAANHLRQASAKAVDAVVFAQKQ